MKSPRLKNEEGTREHISKGIENYEGHSGTICNANNGTNCANNGIGSHIDYKGTIDDISTREIIEGAKVGGTTYDISIGEAVEGAEARS
jgi:hypothetical protein